MKDKLNNNNPISKCGFSIVLLSAYIDNELNEIERQTVENHIKECPVCQKIIEQFGIIGAHLREMEFEEPSREFIFNLKKNVMEKIRRKEKSTIVKFLPALLPVAAVAILVLLITGYEELERPIGMKDKIGIPAVSIEAPAPTEKFDIVIPKPRIVAKTRAVQPSTGSAEKISVADRETELSSEKKESPVVADAARAQEEVSQVVVRAIIDSTGKILNVATGNTITPEEDTTVSRLLKGQQLAPPTIRGKATQMFVEIIPAQPDSN